MKNKGNTSAWGALMKMLNTRQDGVFEGLQSDSNTSPLAPGFAGERAGVRGRTVARMSALPNDGTFSSGEPWGLLSCCLAIVISIGCGKVPSQQSKAQDPGDGQSSFNTSVRHVTTIRLPPPVLGAVFRVESADSTETTKFSTEVFVKCAVCHSLRAPNSENATSNQMDEFHQGMSIAHGQLTCVSCHNSNDNYSSLKLADGRSVSFENSITLCAQCHGTQYRDYQHGAHGGMTGYWDLSRGERVRNHCQHCHDPHVPKYPTFQPVAPPQDRFTPKHSIEGANHGN